MKIVCQIPARYESTRVPRKPLVDICGKPMIWWVYQQVLKVQVISKVYIATDSEIVEQACHNLGLNVIMTKKEHTNCLYRLQEVSQKVPADMYLNVNGDEPLVDPVSIEKVVNESIKIKPDYLFAYRKLIDPAETNDTGNIKVVTNSKNRVLYVSRAPIPCPYKGIDFNYKKFVGIKCLSKKALDLYANTQVADLERIEDMSVLRFLEHEIPVYCTEINSNSLSVDNPRDLERVRHIMEQQLRGN